MTSPDSETVPIALVLDLDDTLIRTDLLVESALTALKTRPVEAFQALLALRRGKAAFKARLASLADLRVDLLPYNEDVLALARSQRERGGAVVLATASNTRYAQAVAEHLGLFDAVHASTETENLGGPRKAERLAERHGSGGFDYAADAMRDLPIWQRARRAITVDAPRSVHKALAAADIEHQALSTRSGTLAALTKALRPHQWLKNALVFLPLFAAHMLGDAQAIAASLLAFIGFSLTASAGYLVNDLLDLEADRAHPRKRQRPFASGALPIRWGLLLGSSI